MDTSSNEQSFLIESWTHTVVTGAESDVLTEPLETETAVASNSIIQQYFEVPVAIIKGEDGDEELLSIQITNPVLVHQPENPITDMETEDEFVMQTDDGFYEVPLKQELDIGPIVLLPSTTSYPLLQPNEVDVSSDDLPLSSYSSASDQHIKQEEDLVSFKVKNGIQRRRERQRRYRQRKREMIKQRNRTYYCERQQIAETTGIDLGFDNFEGLANDLIPDNPEERKKMLRRERDRKYREEHRETLKQRHRDYRQRKKSVPQAPEGSRVPDGQPQEEGVVPPPSDAIEGLESHQQNTNEEPSTETEEVPSFDVNDIEPTTITAIIFF